MYKLIDTHTGTIIKTYGDAEGRKARAHAHRLDAKYGAVRYVARWVAA